MSYGVGVGVGVGVGTAVYLPFFGGKFVQLIWMLIMNNSFLHEVIIW